jgi:hypothetical protein
MVVAIAWLAVGCGSHDAGGSCTYQGHVYAIGDVAPAGDGCNHCTCTMSGMSCTKLACADAGTDAPPGTCTAEGGCPSGPACGAVCCGAGERCDNGTCRCGTGSACPSGDSCEAAGPAGGDACGVICCGATGPCPQ